MTALNYGNQFCKVTVKVQTHKTVGFGYRTSGIATTPIVQAPTFVCGLLSIFPWFRLKKITFPSFFMIVIMGLISYFLRNIFITCPNIFHFPSNVNNSIFACKQIAITFDSNCQYHLYRYYSTAPMTAIVW
jgi:hypothetical protein